MDNTNEKIQPLKCAVISVSTGKRLYCPDEECFANMTDVLPVTIHQTNDAAADSI